jgi:hypothetical protein
MNSAIGINEGPVTRGVRQAATSRNVGAAAVYLTSYLLLDWLSYVQPVLKLGITPWNPPAGLTLAYLLVFGPRWFGVTAVAALLSDVLVRGHSPISPTVLACSPRCCGGGSWRSPFGAPPTLRGSLGWRLAHRR